MVRLYVSATLFVKYVVCVHAFLSTLEFFSPFPGENIFQGSLFIIISGLLYKTLNSTRAVMSFCGLKTKYDAWFLCVFFKYDFFKLVD